MKKVPLNRKILKIFSLLFFNDLTRVSQNSLKRTKIDSSEKSEVFGVMTLVISQMKYAQIQNADLN